MRCCVVDIKVVSLSIIKNRNMNILKAIRDDKFFVDDDKDVICTDNRYTSVLGISGYPHVTSTIDITKKVISDAYYLHKNQFVEKYEEHLLPKAPLTVRQLFMTLRNIIVDEKMSVKSKDKEDKVKKGNRIEQVRNLMNCGITSPNEIAKQIGTNAGYVSLLIKKINEQNKESSE